MTELPAIVTIPAHPHQPMKQANPHGGLGPVDAPECGYHHSIDDENGVFCGATADHSIHHGQDRKVRVCEWDDEEDEN